DLELARSAVRSAVSLPNGTGYRRPESSRPARIEHGERGEIARGRDLIQPLHRAQLLARPGQRQWLSDSGTDPAKPGQVAPGHSGSARIVRWPASTHE